MDQFRNMGIKRQIASPGHIEKYPGEALGATLTFEHKGPGCFVYIGIGIAYGKFVGHNPPFQIIWEHHLIANHTDWTPLSEDVSGMLDIGVQLGKLLDCQKFISDTQPVPGQQPPNDYGANDWDDEVYVAIGTDISLTLKVDGEVVDDAVTVCAGYHDITIGVSNGLGTAVTFEVLGWSWLAIAENVTVGAGEYKEFTLEGWDMTSPHEMSYMPVCYRKVGGDLVCPISRGLEVIQC